MLDIVVLYLASSAALLFAATPIRVTGSDRLVAAAFPLIVLATLHLRRGADDRLGASWLDAGGAAASAVAFSAMLTIALESLLGASHPVGLALRLWLFSSVYLGVARIMLRSIRAQAAVSRVLATDTVVIGAGTIGEHVVKRLMAEPRYGLRPVGQKGLHETYRDARSRFGSCGSQFGGRSRWLHLPGLQPKALHSRQQ